MHSFFLYIDPGSGSLIVQAVLGIALGVGVFFKAIKHKVKLLFGGRKKPAADSDEDEDKIHSEHSGKAE